MKATIDGQEVAYRSKEPYEFKYSPTKLTRMLANPIRTIMGEAPLGEDDQIERTGEAEVLTVNTESGQLYYAFAEEDDFFVVKLIPHGGNDSERLVVSSKGNLYPTNMTEAEARRALKEANSVAKDMKRRLKVEKYRLLSDSAEQLSNQTTQKSLSGKDKETLRDLARRELVESTSFYLKGVIERSLAAHEGQLDVDDIIDIINLEGKTALFMPASIFETAEELVHNYDMYFDMAMGRNKVTLNTLIE
ncbi:MAG: hypothetical protein H6773_04625 [Pseudomonadales bacterium]|nr:hypothetical protein [Pseudomonadales bacterium]